MVLYGADRISRAPTEAPRRGAAPARGGGLSQAGLPAKYAKLVDMFGALPPNHMGNFMTATMLVTASRAES